MGDIHDLLVSQKNELIKLLIIEGHSKRLAEWEFLGMERAYVSETLDFYESQINKTIFNGDETIIISRKADGVVCVSPPKNASCSNSLLAAFALFVGNTIVIKPPLKAPISTMFFWKNVVNRALEINGAPKGCVNIILGNSKKIMEEWLESALVNDIVYFGESEGGLDIGRQAYLRNKKAILELSGNDLFFVWKDADLTKAVASFMDAFLGSTQICMVPKNAIVHSDIYHKFVTRVASEVQKLKVGLPSDPDTFLTPVVKMKDFFNFLIDATEKGAKIICGGKKMDYRGTPNEAGAYIQPTLLQVDYSVAMTMRVVKEENFFPLIPIIEVKGKNDDDIFQKMKEISDSNEYGLRTSVWIADESYLTRFLSEIQNSGLVKINSRHVGFSPFISTHGGTKKSGGPYGEMNFLWQKTSHLQGIVRKSGKK